MSSDRSSFTFKLLPWTKTYWDGTQYRSYGGVGPAGFELVDKINVHTPNFREIRSLGYFLPPQSYSYKRINQTGWVGNSHWHYFGGEGSGDDVIEHFTGSSLDGVGGYSVSEAGNLLMSSSDQRSIDSQARMRLFADIKNRRINFGIVAAERTRTLRLIVTNFNRIVGAVNAFRKGQFGKSLDKFMSMTPRQLKRRASRSRDRYERKAAAAWLEVQYGWRPLMNDVYGGLEKLASAGVGQPREVRATGSASGTIRDQTLIFPRGTAAHPDGRVITRDTNGRYTVKYTAYFRIDYPVSYELSELGLTNPANILWEVIPFSFVIDWFFPIGAFVNQFDTTMGCHFVDGCKTEFWKQTTGYTDKLDRSSAKWSWSGEAYASVELVGLVRSKLYDFPSIPLPQLKSPFSWVHFANAGALLKTLSRK